MSLLETAEGQRRGRTVASRGGAKQGPNRPCVAAASRLEHLRCSPLPPRIRAFLIHRSTNFASRDDTCPSRELLSVKADVSITTLFSTRQTRTTISTCPALLLLPLKIVLFPRPTRTGEFSIFILIFCRLWCRLLLWVSDAMQSEEPEAEHALHKVIDVSRSTVKTRHFLRANADPVDNAQVHLNAEDRVCFFGPRTAVEESNRVTDATIAFITGHAC